MLGPILSALVLISAVLVVVLKQQRRQNMLLSGVLAGSFIVMAFIFGFYTFCLAIMFLAWPDGPKSISWEAAYAIAAIPSLLASAPFVALAVWLARRRAGHT